MKTLAKLFLFFSMLSGLVAVAATASAMPDVSCTENGDTLTFANVGGQSLNVRAGSAWIATVTGETSYQISNADRQKAGSNGFELRYRAGGTTTDVACVANDGPPPASDFTCTQSGSALTWDDIDVSRDVFHVRRLNSDGGTSWVASLTGATSYDNASPNQSYEIRYRITSSPGNTETFNVPCTGGVTPPPATPVTCRTESFGFQTETGFDIVVEGAQDGVSYTLFLDGVESGSNAFPVEVVDFTGRGEDDLFRIDSFGRSLVAVEIAPTNALDARISCGTFGQDPSPVTSCTASEGDAFEVDLFLSPEYVANFQVEVDGAVVDAEPNFPGFPINAFPSSYTVAGNLSNEFTIVQPSGNIECTGDGQPPTEPPAPGTASVCVVSDNGNGVNVQLRPGFIGDFEVAVDGVVTDFTTTEPGGPGAGFVNVDVAAIATSEFTIIQPGTADLNCGSDNRNFCDNFGGFLFWTSVPNLWNDEYNVRRVNSDGSSSWVGTSIGLNQFNEDLGDGEFFIRYRIEDDAGNRTVFNEPCEQG